MPDWPPIDAPELLERLAMDDREFERFLRNLAGRLPRRAYDPMLLARALGYPWARPDGSYLLTAAGIEPLAAMTAAARDRALARYTGGEDGRLPVLAIGSNAAPRVLEGKFAHFPDPGDRAVLALTGRLHDFDVGAAAQPTLYGAMPATLFASPGTAVSTTVLWVTPTQFTQLAWSELSYRLGKLRTRFEVAETADEFAEVLVFASRFGAFCPGGKPVALTAVAAEGRTATALAQERLLDAAAALALGPGANAETLVRAIFEDGGEVLPRIAATVRRESVPLSSARWTPFRASELPPATG